MKGREIAGRYQVQEELGSGGMGTVYRGLDRQSGTIVAIKHLKPEMARPDLIERFQREGEALRDLNHPNMVKMHASFEEDGDHYLVMDYVSGGDLKDWLQRGTLSIEETLNIAIDLADALTRAHRLSIIHRDLKPANILIAEDGSPRLTDFGVARLVSKEQITDSQAIIGTFDYLAPEVFGDHTVDNRVDIWAFGVLLFQMLTGELPFKGASVVQKITAITTEDPPDLEKLRPETPVDLIDLIYRMLDKDRNVRIVSMRHIGASLEDILQGRSLHTPPETRFATPISVTIKRPKHNLPAQTTEFVGREQELGELAKMLATPAIRLITIVASGGMGKTRLTIEVARHQIPHFEHGVYFVELAPLSNPANIPSAIAEATGYSFVEDGRSQEQQILDFLADKHLLLVMDNFEHLLAGSGLVTAILNGAPAVQILVSSRQKLNQSWETVFNLSGIDYPQWETPDDAFDYAGVKLFTQSARRAQSQFEVTADNMGAIARICLLVQGMPLGILLAASWCGMLSVSEIASEIARGIDFLESDMSDLPDRHRSVRAVFDYSWNLMSETERAVFMKLSVFRGGFTREAAQEVAGASLRNLMSLVNKSLIRRDFESGRYEVHELLRQYGEQHLVEHLDEDAVRHQHMRYYLVLLDKLEPKLRGSQQINSLKQITTEMDNIVIAWKLAVHDHEEALLIAGIHALIAYFVWFKDDHRRDELIGTAMREFINHRQDYERLWCYLLLEFGHLFPKLSETDYGTRFHRALAVAETHQDKFLKAFTYMKRGESVDTEDKRAGNDENSGKATALFQEIGHDFFAALSMKLSFKVDDIIRASNILTRIGNQLDVLEINVYLGYICCFYIGEWERGKAYGKEAYEKAQSMAYESIMATAVNLLTWAAIQEADFETAKEYIKGNRAIRDVAQWSEAQNHPYLQLALMHTVLDELDKAEAILLEEYVHEVDVWDTFYRILAIVRCGQGRYQEAVDLLSGKQFMRQNGAHTYLMLVVYMLYYESTGDFAKASGLLHVLHTAPIPIRVFEVWSKTSGIKARLQEAMGVAEFERAWDAVESLDVGTVVQAIWDEFSDGDGSGV